LESRPGTVQENSQPAATKASVKSYETAQLVKVYLTVPATTVSHETLAIPVILQASHFLYLQGLTGHRYLKGNYGCDHRDQKRSLITFGTSRRTLAPPVSLVDTRSYLKLNIEVWDPRISLKSKGEEWWKGRRGMNRDVILE
jgi:hypothetical protein